MECDIAGAWETVTGPVDIQALLASRTDADVRKRLVQQWDAKLTACRRSERLKL